MIDNFTIFHRGGAVLWSRTLNPDAAKAVNPLIQNVLLQERKAESSFKFDNFTLKWIFQNELDLVFVAVYLNLSQLLYIDDLLEEVKRAFCKLYKEDTIRVCPVKFDFDHKFDKIVEKFESQEMEKKLAPRKPRTFDKTSKGQKLGVEQKKKKPKKKAQKASKNPNVSIRDVTGDAEDGADSDGGDDENEADGEQDQEEEEEEEEDQDKAETKNDRDAGKPTAAKPSEDGPAQPAEATDYDPASTTDAASAADTTDGDDGTDADSHVSKSRSQQSLTDDEEPADSFPLSPSKLKLLAKRGASGPRPGRGRAGRGRGGKGKGASVSTPEPSGPPKKKAQKWVEEMSQEEKDQLDFSKKPSSADAASSDSVVEKKVKYMTTDGEIPADPTQLYHSDDESSESDDEVKGDAPKRGMFSFLKELVTGTVLRKEDLQPALEQMRQNLMTKNVAADIAEKLCESVGCSLEGKTIGTFSTIKSTVKKNMEEALTQILTPKKSVDVLQGVLAARAQGRPYTIVFVGVNGVGKSTSLAKLCAYFLHKSFKVMIAACDTFRAGAVEQLRTHASCLQVPLFERGYNRDGAGIALDATKEAKKKGIDVVLVDTAGRMQHNEPLMRALSKLINTNKPDLVLFVGEALVGNDAVDQLTQFNQCLVDLSSDETPRLIDGIILTKFDTIDDKVGAAISMTYTTGQPIMFVGTGQTYDQLKKMNVKMLIKALLK